MNFIFSRSLFFSVFFLLTSLNCYAMEVIKNYESQIIIEPDSSLIVTEKITVNAEGKEIKRGIYRDFPTRYKDIHGNNYNVKFEILSVMRDGQTEDYHTESLSNGIRIYIGKKNHFLKQGTHTFTIQYYTNRQLGFFEQYDELYWNVTGNGWAFPILKANASIKLPPGVSINQIATEAYTGAQGDKGKNFVVSTLDDTTVFFDTTNSLPLHHGLSVVVNWPKGYVQEPSQQEKILWFFQDNQATLVGFMGLATLWFYLFFTWLKVGKDPEKGVIYPRYYPDKEHSPASMRFVQRMGYDNKAFSSALVNMAVKGYLTITMKTKYFTIDKIGGAANLSLGESAIARSLFNRKNQVVLKQEEHSIISKAISAHKKALTRDYEKLFFNTNKMALLPGWIGSVIILAITIFSIESSEARAVSAFFTVWLSIWSIGVTFLSIMAYHAWKNVQGFLTLLPALGATAFATPFIGGEVAGLYFFWQNAGSGVLLVFILTIITNILFYEWMKAPTLKGRELLDKVDGFKQYLMVTKTEELQQKNPSGQLPELTPELFEKYLPYAMALDVEKQWSERFSSIFSQLEQRGEHHKPLWYTGRHWDTHNLTGFSSAMGDTLNSAISSSSTAPGSSSGGGGSSGGSSGGGGGGGGGGGW
ncbi:MAG: DUF2207 domain-containing protein [Gammaproteobacteria bacterium]|nr:DUF2207 domain-containing protein [Gammaproteobacteria bacterium]